MKEAAVHTGTVEHSHRAGVAVGQDRLRSELTGNRAELSGDRVERLVPRDAGEAALALGADALLRI